MSFSLFSDEARLEKLSKIGDPLEKLSVIDWNIFSKVLNGAFTCKKTGRPPYDTLLLFKILVLQRMYNLSDDQIEYQINDRISFMRFLGLTTSDKVPDSKTIWLFREKLNKTGLMRKLFDAFKEQIASSGMIAHEGTIVDATFVDVPKQRNTREENKTVKENKIPEEWQDNKNKLRQKDTDARWAKKNSEIHYGYKNHVKADSNAKLITDYTVTDASVHDSKELGKLLDSTDKRIYADSAYADIPIPEHIENQINEKGHRNRPLTELQKKRNEIKTRVRCRVEHIFAFMTNSMKGLTLRSIGKARAELNIGLTNLVYNLFRYSFLMRRQCV